MSLNVHAAVLVALVVASCSENTSPVRCGSVPNEVTRGGIPCIGDSKETVLKVMGDPDLVESSVTCYFYYYFDRGCLLQVSSDEKVGVMHMAFYSENKYFKAFVGTVLGVSVGDSPDLVRRKLGNAARCGPPVGKGSHVLPFPRDGNYSIKVASVISVEGEAARPYGMVEVNFDEQGRLICILVPW